MKFQDGKMQQAELAALEVAFCPQGISRQSIARIYAQVILPLLHRIETGSPELVGVLGLQGTGKTTLCNMLIEIGRVRGVKIASLSIDDLYLSYGERCALREKDERFKWRGPPGTHSISEGVKVLRDFKAGAEYLDVPRFDKSLHEGHGDRVASVQIKRPDVLLFEGWFVGCRPLPESFDFESCDLIEDPEFSRTVNESLREYVPLWELLDQFICYVPEDYKLSYTWRLEAERKMRAELGRGMSDEEVKAFVSYFWQSLHPELYVAPLVESSRYMAAQYVDGVITVDRNRDIRSAQWCAVAETKSA